MGNFDYFENVEVGIKKFCRFPLEIPIKYDDFTLGNLKINFERNIQEINTPEKKQLFIIALIDFLALKISQSTESNELKDEYITSMDELERLTKLNFFPRLIAGEQKEVEPGEKKASEIW